MYKPLTTNLYKRYRLEQTNEQKTVLKDKIRSLRVAKQDCKLFAVNLNIVGYNTKKKEIVCQYFAPGSEENSIVIKEIYDANKKKIKDMSTQLANFDENAIEGMARLFSGLNSFISEYRRAKHAVSVDDESRPQVSYKRLYKTFVGGAYTQSVVSGDIVLWQWIFKNCPNFSVIQIVKGCMGSKRNQAFTKWSKAEDVELTIDDEMHILPFQGATVYKKKDTSFLIVIQMDDVKQGMYGPQPQVVLFAAPDKIQECCKLARELEDQYAIYKNRVININACGMSIKTKLNKSEWSDIVYDQKVRQECEFVEGCIQKVDELKNKGLSIKRGILISGEPGVGKSHSLQCMLTHLLGKCTIFVVESLGQTTVHKVYEMAQKLAPAIVVWEDLDLITYNRQNMPSANNGIFSELLTSLSSISQYNVVTIATTNHPEHLDKALKERPGRFDNHIKVELPDYAKKVQILQLYLKKTGVDESKWISIEAAVEKILKQPVTGAHIKELVEKAAKSAILAGREVDCFSFKAEEATVSTVTSTEQRKVGFAR